MNPEERENKFAAEGDGHMRAGEYSAAITSFQSAMEIAVGRGDKYSQSIYLANCGSSSLALGKHHEAELLLDRAVSLAVELGNRGDELRFRRSLAIAFFEQRMPEPARKQIEAALKIAEDQQYYGEKPELLGYMGIVNSMVGAHDAAFEYYQRALSKARVLHLTAQEGIISGNLGHHYVAVGEYEQALSHFQDAIVIARELGDHHNEEKWAYGLEQTRSLLAIVHDPNAVAENDYAHALGSHGSSSSIEQQIDLWLRSARSCRLARHYDRCADSLANAGLLFNQLGRFDDADRRFNEAMDVLRSTQDQRRIGLVHMNRGVSLRDRGDTVGSLGALTEAVHILRQASAERELVHALDLLADAYVNHCEADRALPLFRKIEDSYRKSGHREGLATTLIKHATAATDDHLAESLFREAMKVSHGGRITTLVPLAAMGLASILERQARKDEAIRELLRIRKYVNAEAPKELSAAYSLNLARLVGVDHEEHDSFEIWQDAFEAAEAANDLPSVVRALGGISTIYSRRLAAVRTQLRQASGSHGPSTPPELSSGTSSEGLGEIADEDAAVELLQSMFQARNEELLRILQDNMTRFSQVVFDSLAFNIERALGVGDSERAGVLESMARGIVTEQSQSLRIASTLFTQLVQENREVIVHIEPDAKIDPNKEDPAFTRRAAEEVYRDAGRLLAAQRFKEAFQRFQNSLDLFTHLEDAAKIAECLGNLAFCASETGHLPAALEYAERAQSEFIKLGDQASVAKILLIIGGILQTTGQLDDAIRSYEAACEAARLSNAPATEASALSNIGAVLHRRGDLQDAVHWYERALTLKRAQGEREPLMTTLNNLGSLYRELGDTQKSETMLSEARQIIEGTGDKRNKAAFFNNAGATAIHSGKPAEAEVLLYDAMHIASEIGDPTLEFQILMNLVVALRAQGKWDAVDKYLAAADDLQHSMGGSSRPREILMHRVDASAIRGDYHGIIASGGELIDKHSEELPTDKYISLLSTLWGAYRTTGNVLRATECRNRLLEIIQQETRRKDAERQVSLFLLCCRALGVLAVQGEADPEDTLSLVERGVRVAERAGLDEQLAELYEHEASLFRMTGRLGDSLAAHARAIEFSKSSGNAYQQAVFLTNMATALREIGKLQESATAFGQALTLCRQVQAAALEPQILIKYAVAVSDLGRDKQRVHLAREAAEAARRVGDRWAEARAFLLIAGSLLETDAVRAEAEIKRVLESEAGIPKDLEAEALGLYALALRAQKRYGVAIELAERAVMLLKKSAVEEATALFYAGLIYFEADRQDEALDRLGRSLVLLGQDVASPLSVNIHELRGDVYLKEGGLDLAIEEYETAINQSRSMRGHVPDERDRLARLSEFVSIHDKLAHVFLRKHRFIDAFDTLEAGRSRTLVERLGLSDLPVPPTIPSDLRNKERTCLEELATIDRQMMASGSVEQGARLSASYASVQQRYEEVLEQVAHYSPEYVEWRRGAALTFDRVCTMLAN